MTLSSAAAAAAAADGDDEEDDDGGVEPWETSFLRDSYTVPKQHTVPATQLRYLNEKKTKHIFWCCVQTYFLIFLCMSIAVSIKILTLEWFKE